MPDALTVSIADHGAVADYGEPGVAKWTDNRSAFLAAIADLKLRMRPNSNARGRIYVPGALYPYYISSTVPIVDEWIEVVGDGSSSQLVCQEGPALRFGLRDTEAGPNGATIALDASYRPLRALDGTLGGYAVATKGDASLYFAACPLTLGPRIDASARCNWSDVTGFTVEIAVERPDHGVWPAGEVEGIWQFGGFGGGQANQPCIISLRKGGGLNQFDCEITDTAGNQSIITFFAGDATGLLKLGVQCDLGKRQAWAWVNGLQVATAFTGNASGSLARNDFAPWIFGVSSLVSDGRVPVRSPNAKITDMVIHGFSLSTNQRYIPGAIGSPQKRVDTQAVNDNTRFGPGNYSDLGLLCYLVGEQPESPTSRVVKAFARDTMALYHGYLIQRGQFTVQGGLQRNAVRDIALSGWNNTDSPVLVMGGMLDMEIEDVTLAKGTRGVSAMDMIASYRVRVDGLKTSGISDTSYYGAWQVVTGQDWDVENCGRAAVTLWACDSHVRQFDVRLSSTNTDAIVDIRRGMYGGSHVFVDVMSDFEGGACKTAAFRAEQNIDMPTTLIVSVGYLGTAGGNATFDLTGVGYGHMPATLRTLAIDAGVDPIVVNHHGEGWQVYVDQVPYAALQPPAVKP